MNFLFSLFLFLISFTALAAGEITLNTVNVECSNSEDCGQRKIRFSNLVGEYRSLLHLKETLKILASDGGYQSFSYDLLSEADQTILNIRIKIKSMISEINIGYTDRNLEVDPSQLLTVKEGEFFENNKLRESIDGLQKRLESLGYPHNTHELFVTEKGTKIIISLAITLGKPRIFKSVRTNSNSIYIKEYLKKKFIPFYDKPFDPTKFKLYLDDAQKELFLYGYYLISMDFAPVIKNDRVTLEVKVTNDKLFAFDFKNVHQESRDVIHALIKDLFRKYKRPLSELIITNGILEHYQKKALINATVKIDISTFKNMYGETVNLYRITLDEKYKTRMTEVTFIGNAYYTEKKLHKYFEEEAFELASINYYDAEYLNFFSGSLKEKYVKNGFVQVKIQGPIKIFDSEKKTVSVEYIIQEGLRAMVRGIEFVGLPTDFEETILKKMSNKESTPFNPIEMVEDLKKVSTILHEKGYYFAEVTNANEDNVVRYSKSGADVYLRFEVNAGPLVKLNRLIFLGNNKTRKRILQKKILLKKNDIVTPSQTREIEAALSATGLFNSVTVIPMRHTSKNTATDLIIKVTEREYGLVEFAPGFRTDLGLKLTGTASYLNVAGENLAVTLRSQVNQRVNNQTLDKERRKQNRKFLEHNTTLTFTKGDIYDTLIDSTTSFSYQRKRFYSFDADIVRGNTTLTRQLSNRLSSSIRYQLENIKQNNSLVNSADNGSFRIGAITPSLTWDLRNSLVNPRSGGFFNVSTEFANPFFLSQEEPDLTINYYKFVSRNRFYIPFKNGTVAISMVGGVQQNLARDTQTDAAGATTTKGYIPNIKVFRLTGMDIIRGYTDEEANKLPDKRDISEFRVDNRAYLAMMKLEPRYFINDSLIAGVFYDAGRVFVNNVALGELRDSVGVTFKILTPVGTLDFDYGIKLLRKKNQDGSLEDPGRFHVSIGFF